MEEAAAYIFNSLSKAESIAKSTNRKFTMFAVATIAYVIFSEKRHKEHELKIKRLSDEIKDMKTLKGV